MGWLDPLASQMLNGTNFVRYAICNVMRWFKSQTQNGFCRCTPSSPIHKCLEDERSAQEAVDDDGAAGMWNHWEDSVGTHPSFLSECSET